MRATRRVPRSGVVAFLTGALALLVGGCKAEPGGAPVGFESPAVFVDATRDSGLDFEHCNGAAGAFHLPEIMGSGGGLVDLDGDGDLDLYAVQGGRLVNDPAGPELPGPSSCSEPGRDRIYRNDLEVLPDGSRSLRLTEVIPGGGLVANGFGIGVATGDINNDGRVDLYRTSFGPNQLWRNDGGWSFRDVTEGSGADDERFSTSAVFFDYDRDGWLDLYVVNYVAFTLAHHKRCTTAAGRPDYCNPAAYDAVHDRLLHNRGDGTFEDLSRKAGILAVPPRPGLGVISGDFDDDGWPDLYVANDLEPNVLWLNQRDGTFRNAATLAGCAVNYEGKSEASMGVAAGDVDGDGDEDLFMTHLNQQTNTLYLNDGRALFQDRTHRSHLAASSASFTGFGTSLLDFDNDGWLDVMVVNGAVYVLEAAALEGDPFPFRQTDQLFRNRGDATFEELGPRRAGAPFDLADVSRGLATGDLDNDGDTDAVVFNDGGPARVLLNQVGSRRSWIGLRLVGGAGERDLLGAQATLSFPGRSLRRQVRSGGSYLSAHDPRLLFGLGGYDGVVAARIQWPDGSQEEWTDLRPGQYLRLVQGDGRKVEKNRDAPDS